LVAIAVRIMVRLATAGVPDRVFAVALRRSWRYIDITKASLAPLRPLLASGFDFRWDAMRHTVFRLAVTAALAVGSAAALADDGAAAWLAAQRAQAAEEALSGRYTALWRTLDAGQKAAFSARERAWLNGGRQDEQRACVAHARSADEAVLRSCEAFVRERHLATLAVPARVAAAH
jgi:hypothetical protein